MTTTTGWTRGTRLAEAVGRTVLRLPAARTPYHRVDEHVPMRDGVVLEAVHYVPETAHPLGTVLVRSPYGRTGSLDELTSRALAARGYHVIVQSCRGTFGSGGGFEPMANEAADGHDTVVWLREQGWFDGRLATLGASYLGWVQWTLLLDPPPELKTVILVVAPHDFGLNTYGTGAFTLADFLSWSDMMAHQEDRGALLRRAWTRQQRRAALDGVPLDAAAEPLLEGRAPWYREWVGRPDLDDGYWAARNATAALDRVDVPVLLVGGWQDIFLRQTVGEYEHLRARGLDVALTVGPWTHVGAALGGSSVIWPETLNWLDEHLAGAHGRVRPAPVHVKVTGAGGGWRHHERWPPPTAPHERYLQPGGLLGVTDPGADPVALFRYDPADPTPTVGGRLLVPPAGVADQKRLESRPDVVLFDSEPLTHACEVQGVPVVELRHSTDNPHADLFVRISDVGRRSHNVTDGYVRLDPDRDPDAPLRLELDPCAHRFAAGHRIRVLIAGGSHPRFDRNPGTGAGPLEVAELAGATHTVHGGRLTLPLVDEG